MKQKEEKKIVNKNICFVRQRYDSIEEDKRFDLPSYKIEFLTTFRYIKKYLKRGMKILEIGAGTGAYSVQLAKSGFDVTAVEPIESNICVMKKKAKKLKNLKILQGDAMDLSMFDDNTFDLVLVLGPMYHVFNQKDKMQVVNNSIRVAKKNAVLFFAYLNHTAIVLEHGVKKAKLNEVAKFFNKDFSIKDVPSEVFNAFYNEAFEKLFEKTKTKHLHTVAADGVAPLLRDCVNALPKSQYNILLKYHFGTCERKDFLGTSSHMIYICKKS